MSIGIIIFALIVYLLIARLTERLNGVDKRLDDIEASIRNTRKGPK